MVDEEKKAGLDEEALASLGVKRGARKVEFDLSALKRVLPDGVVEKDDSEVWFVIAKLFQHLTLDLDYDGETLYDYLLAFSSDEPLDAVFMGIQKAVDAFVKETAQEFYKPDQLSRIPEFMRELSDWSGSRQAFYEFISEVQRLDLMRRSVLGE
ncbi:MAG: hypothetical protein ACTSU5_15785 [Promethearchaeota archaeon]